ncbi:peptide chain release factor N(5)-glutamine methyltransferase [Mucilaginibacter sp. UR6-1]|uniref:peptide chain release factor N(5)-glutamine methyltransferase n=1 Tax=Mucilaginibacter sp. UR6-1 TaxID=1435643 RepID=UPI001E4D8AAB|nr:peptide chain release factor N(5)-glutamine methyltransferase [Mucilaginibacter sp. UR6-1]MCC8410268.1 peptide chain release factor N(5)-glutamine methyltransferase [Mucilaginibacter sp. UR6-1]
METVKDVFNKFRQRLAAVYDAQETEALTLAAIAEITQLGRAGIKAFPERELSNEQSARLDDIATQLQSGKPLQYVLGKAEFYGLTFNVNPSVLIPRPETEELVEWVIGSLGIGQWSLVQGANILDIGTGSGCIAISLKKNLAAADVSAMDISADALQTAQGNAVLNRVEVNFMERDILSAKPDAAKYDVIVSNPPYVTSHDKRQMHTNVTDFEPHTALFVPDEEPLLFYKVIADYALQALKNPGMLFFEINESYGTETVAMLAAKGFTDIELRKDMSGRDRMIKAIK